MTPWIRLWRDMPTDPKFRAIAKKSGRPVSDVVSVFVAMMVAADDAGIIDSWCADDCAAGLDLDAEHVESIEAAMQGKVLDGRRLRGWDKRQPKREDDSRDRVRAFRERKKSSETNTETPCNADVTQRNAPDSDSDKDSDTITIPESDAAREGGTEEVQPSVLKGSRDSGSPDLGPPLRKLVATAEGFGLDTAPALSTIDRKRPEKPYGYAIAMFRSQLRQRLPPSISDEVITAALKRRPDAYTVVTCALMEATHHVH